MFKNTLVTTMILSLVLISCAKKDVQNTENTIIDKTETTKIIEEKVVEDKKEENKSEEKVNSTMVEIFKKWEPTTCTFKIIDEKQTYDAIMYVDGKKMRYSMNWKIEWNQLESNVIIKDGFSYSWSNMGTEWFKIKNDLEKNNTDSQNTQGQGQEMNQKYEFNCKKWVDLTVFELPSNINFQEFDIQSFPQVPNPNNVK